MVFWLLLESAMEEEDRPWRTDFLSARERERFERLRFPRRRREWLLGRYAAKALLSRAEADLAERSWSAIEILSEAGGAPVVFVDEQPRTGTLSISHRAGLVFVAWRPDGGALGVDVERIEERKGVFVEDYFTPAEQESLGGLPPDQHMLAVTLLWSLKEAALKALRQGLRLDTRRLSVRLSTPFGSAQDWQPCEVVLPAAPAPWPARWRRQGDYVLTAISGETMLPLEGVGRLLEVGGSLW